MADLVAEMEGIRDRLHEVCESMRLAIRQRLEHGAEKVIHGGHAGRSFGGVGAALERLRLIDVRVTGASMDETLKAFILS